MTTVQEWLDQSARDLSAARTMLGAGLYEWTAYASAQAAEKAAKALLVAWGVDLGRNDQAKRWKTHDLSDLLHQFRALPTNAVLADAVATLPTHDQNARYPGSGGPDAPCKRYTEPMAKAALERAEALTAYCTALVPTMQKAWADLSTTAAGAVGGGPPSPTTP